MSAEPDWDGAPNLVEFLIEEQQTLSAVETFSAAHDATPEAKGRYESLIPSARPGEGEQFAFRVDLDACTGCKACVTACHNLNGLDADETWRKVGLVETSVAHESIERQQTVTAACHHCAEPGCMAGCPVQAYDKDPTTGIVRHLDDQCIGCRYCQLMCPYDVPTWSDRLGIVRKCDMCHSRLSEGEAPACVQGCPNGAISIQIVEVDPKPADAALLPVVEGAMPPSRWTNPVTQYVSTRETAFGVDAADARRVEPNHAHMPLAIMLVLTQAAIGASWGDALLRLFGVGGTDAAFVSVVVPTLALAVALPGLAASIAHLGRPQWAFRAVLGLRTSWMSREIVVLGAFAGALAALALTAWVEAANLDGATAIGVAAASLRTPLAWVTALVGAFGLFCSAQIYGATRRPFWTLGRTSLRFIASAVWAGVAAVQVGLAASAVMAAISPTAAQAALAIALMGLTSLRRITEAGFLLAPRNEESRRALDRSNELLAGPLRRTASLRRKTLAVAGFGGPLLLLLALGVGSAPGALTIATLVFVTGIVSDIVERRLFFQAEAMPSMPGMG